MILPALLTSFSADPPAVLEKLLDFSCTAVNFSVCVVLCALATAGSMTAPAPARTTAAPAAAMDVRIFMEYLRVSGRPIWIARFDGGYSAPTGRARAARSRLVIGDDRHAASMRVRVVSPGPGSPRRDLHFYLGTGDSLPNYWTSPAQGEHPGLEGPWAFDPVRPDQRG